MTTNTAFDANRALWDEWSAINRNSEMCDVEGFIAGKGTLTEVDRAVVGDVSGRSFLHLRCHFGMDTLSWARAGAEVTGVDFSSVAVEQARALAARAGLPATFLQAAMGSVHTRLPDAQFEVVYTSYGVLSWLDDLEAWARDVARLLRPGGRFHIIEFHPTLGLFDDEGRSIEHSYFRTAEPLVFQETESYAGGQHAPMPCYQWTHTLADIQGSLLCAGLRITAFDEYPFCCHACYPFLQEDGPGRYVMRDHPGKIPLLFSLTAERPGQT